MLARANQEMHRLVDGSLTGPQFIHEFLQQQPGHTIQEPDFDFVNKVELFGLWLEKQLMPVTMPNRSTRTKGHEVLEGIAQDMCFVGGKVLNVQATYDDGTRLPYDATSKGVRVYNVKRDSRVTISAQNLGVAASTIIPVYDSEHGDERKEPKELLARSETRTAVCASILGADETEDRWRLDLDDRRSLVVVRLCAAAS
eukprot:438865-Rhodomonas_salina.2